MTTFVLAGGGTAGHVNPLLATADALCERIPDARIVTVGTAGGLETELVPRAGYELELIERAPFPRSLSIDALKFPGRYLAAAREAKNILRRTKADVLIGFGGYASTPMYRAAQKLGIPIIVHEGNARPGMANKVGARHAHVVALTFPSTDLRAAKGVTETIGLPLRQLIRDLAREGRERRRSSAATRFGLDPDRPVLLVTGGSLGAQRLNETVQTVAGQFPIQILHITGKGKDGPVREAIGDATDYHVLDYVTDMDNAYAVADLVITRAGAGMVAESSALGIPAIFVPLPIGNGEQELNAKDVVDAGGAVIVKNEDFTPEWLAENLPTYLDADKRAQMSDAARGVSPINADQRLAELTLSVLGK
ncbi:MAG: undecaprenyldiphospho-muramoylpentapeptide beta-N-acetylglucosaminyltransferase [Actinomycetaceae bacterium]|nr:undecaprenyldiphospho-muramoylpentapeptide beta-N-acetylglucosaminyltransferase [Actinomycetaceae bacterium]